MDEAKHEELWLSAALDLKIHLRTKTLTTSGFLDHSDVLSVLFSLFRSTNELHGASLLAFPRDSGPPNNFEAKRVSNKTSRTDGVRRQSDVSGGRRGQASLQYTVINEPLGPLIGSIWVDFHLGPHSNGYQMIHFTRGSFVPMLDEGILISSNFGS